MPSSPLRRKLRAAGHHLSAIVQVGKEGVTEPVLRQLDQALRDHELVKVKLGTESPEDRFEAAARLADGAGAALAQVLGRTLLVYRKHPERSRYEPGPDTTAPSSPRKAGSGPGRGGRPGASSPSPRKAGRGPGRGARPDASSPSPRKAGRGPGRGARPGASPPSPRKAGRGPGRGARRR